MTEKAADVVKDALAELTVQAQEQVVPAVDMQTGIRYLNRMVASWSARDIKLGYTRVENPDDILTVPEGAIEGIVTNLALRLANGFDVSVSQTLVDIAAIGMNTIRDIGLKLDKTAFPANLPIGSGNEDSGGIYSGDHFFPDCCEDVNPCGTNTTSNGDTNGV